MIIKPEDVLINCSTFDKEHVTLVNLINGIYKLLQQDKKELAKEIFHEGLVAYTESHLKHEEEFMSMYKYPELDAHIKAHQIFRKIIVEDLSNFESPKDFVSNLGLSMSWIFTHIRKTDRKYVEFFVKMGVYEKTCTEKTVPIDKSLESFLRSILTEDFIDA